MKKVISLLLIIVNFLLMIPTYTFASEYCYPGNVVVVEKSSGTLVSDVLSVVKLALGAGILYVLYEAGIIGLMGSFAGLLAKGISGITNVGADIRAGKLPKLEDVKMVSDGAVALGVAATAGGVAIGSKKTTVIGTITTMVSAGFSGVLWLFS